MKNEYTQKTRVLGIPVLGHKDGIWPEVEMKKWTIVENLLLASLKGIQNCIFNEGDLAMRNGKVVLQATGQSSSAEGVVGGAYFKAPPRVEWILPSDKASCFLYLKGFVGTYENPGAVRPVTSVSELKERAVLFASVKNGKLNTAPEGKVFSGDIAKHMGVSVNPHGKTLVQDEVEAARLLVGGKEVRVPETVDFETAGKDGVILTVKGSVSFVQVCRSGAMTPELVGEVSVGYFGFDKKVVNSESFVVYNNGDAGICARALVF